MRNTYIAEQNGKKMLMVEGKPFIMLAGEVHNSNASSVEYMEQVYDKADALFSSEVPQEFVSYMKQHTDTMVPDVKRAVENGAAGGNWTEVFGDCAGEIFSAYYTAGYVNAVAAAGKKEYALPMTANCWLDKGGAPGTYPTGGPVSRMMEVWSYGAPEIDIIGPDIYVQNFLEICDEYTRRNTPLFIPECATHSYAGPREVYCVGHYHALCYSPFGFEDMGEPFSATQSYLFGVDVEDPALKTPMNVEEYRWYTRTLHEMMPLLTAKYGTSDLQAVSCERKEEDKMLFGTFGFQIALDSPVIARKDGVCLILKESEDTFYLLIHAAAFGYFSTDSARPNVDVLSFEEGHFEHGVWIPGRRFNGDEVVNTVYQEPVLLKLKLFAYL